MKKICFIVLIVCSLCGCANSAYTDVDVPETTPPVAEEEVVNSDMSIPAALVGTYAKWDIEMDTVEPMLMSVNMGIISVDKLVVSDNYYLVYEDEREFILDDQNNRATLYIGDVNQVKMDQNVNYCVSGDYADDFVTKLYEVYGWTVSELDMFLEACQKDMESQPYIFFTLENNVDLSEWKP